MYEAIVAKSLANQTTVIVAYYLVTMIVNSTQREWATHLVRRGTYSLGKNIYMQHVKVK